MTSFSTSTNFTQLGLGFRGCKYLDYRGIARYDYSYHPFYHYLLLPSEGRSVNQSMDPLRSISQFSRAARATSWAKEAHSGVRPPGTSSIICIDGDRGVQQSVSAQLKRFRVSGYTHRAGMHQ